MTDDLLARIIRIEAIVAEMAGQPEAAGRWIDRKRLMRREMISASTSFRWARALMPTGAQKRGGRWYFDLAAVAAFRAGRSYGRRA